MRFVYHSFEGRFSDSPRALYERLEERPGIEHIWLTGPGAQDPFPPGVTLLEYGSPACVEALEHADLLVANTHTDFAWDKRPETLYLQTWHGTPLKRIHWDVLWAPEGRLERLQRDVDRWDVLLSPNRDSTVLLERAFRFDREILEAGYPRNDVLLSPQRDAIRARVREELGIADDRTVVLYTPTWRDDAVFEEGGKPFSLDLDVDRFAERLGDDHVLLLRLHRMLAGRSGAARHESVRDVSAWPEVSDLYLAADAMVTDYSSTMFDFAVTGKPMLFYTYDLDDYRDRLRGFYLDIAEIAPGPLVATTEALVDAIADLPAIASRHADAYARFRERFCHHEDGHATERVIARLPLIAHRGASGEAPENTLAAFDLAVAQGADVLELDVRVTAGGDLVTLHDPTLERTTGDPRRHDELVELPDHPAAPATLEAVLDRHAAHAFLVDLKDPEPAWEQRVVEVIDRRGLHDRAMVQSFDLDALGRLHAHAPWLRVAALYRRADSVELDVADVPPFASAVGAWHPVVDEAFVAKARERGLAVHPWTVDDVEEAERLVALGVEGVITNVPGVVGDAVRQSADDRATAPLRQ